jgi:hypothetical protein
MVIGETGANGANVLKTSIATEERKQEKENVTILSLKKVEINAQEQTLIKSSARKKNVLVRLKWTTYFLFLFLWQHG